ncbi:MAG: glycoside hydrolase family 97 protein [Bacteroidales bacterium]|nr:glycoside hydrolase family 97 protein [Bacteroidales bacterium]MCF8455529.1 glycoside hydrolase family 97 protein [Bacteroidales bacterium]
MPASLHTTTRDRDACILVVLLLILMVTGLNAQTTFTLSSPDQKIQTHIKFGDYIEFEVLLGSEVVVEKTWISLNIDENKLLGHIPKIRKHIARSVDEVVVPVVAEKFASIPEKYNELEFFCRGNYTIIFRAYNEGIAWRFTTKLPDNIRVNTEEATINFPKGSSVWFPEENSFFSHNERYYLHEKIDSMKAGHFCSLPALVETQTGTKVLISESDLQDYPGMWLQTMGTNGLNGIFPGLALKETKTSDRDVKVAEHAPYLCITKGTRSYPWRVLAIAENDGDLLTNQLTYLLAGPNKIEDSSWIKPGKVAWDWWNEWNIYGVDFEAGVNTETYKYYIDFASKYGIEYIIMDEGWYELGNLLKVVPDIDMEEILAYAKEKNVGVILWVIWKTLEDQWQDAFDQFERWGVKGLKVDFMQRDDQWMVNYYWRVAEEAAKRKMLVDFHGAYKPAGLRRTYPNVITREGLRGLEQSKWSDLNTPDHNVTLPFIRMVAGPMDYTPGAMVNATQKNFKPIYTQAMSMGTRCHQLAMYVVYESPLQMLCDNPSNYLKEPECMEFLSEVPTVWDKTIVLSAKIGEQVVLARKHGDVWFIGAMSNWDARNIDIDFSFLGKGKYEIRIWQDGANAHRYASDFKKHTESITKKSKMTINLAPGGGWVGIISKK